MIGKDSVLRCDNPRCYRKGALLVLDNDIISYPTCPACFWPLNCLGKKTTFDFHIINTEEQKNRIQELESTIASRDALIKQIMNGRVMRLMTKLRLLINKII